MRWQEASMIIYAGSFPIADGSHDAVRQALSSAREQALAAAEPVPRHGEG